MRMMSMVLAVSCLLGTGACASLGYGGGAVVAVSGAVVVAHAVSVCDENGVACALVGFPEAAAGGTAVLLGLGTIVVTALAQAISGELHQPAAATAATPEPEPTPAAAPASWPGAAPPSPSPSAPSGSPLAPAQSLSLRPSGAASPGAAPSGARSLMAFH